MTFKELCGAYIPVYVWEFARKEEMRVKWISERIVKEVKPLIAGDELTIMS